MEQGVWGVAYIGTESRRKHFLDAFFEYEGVGTPTFSRIPRPKVRTKRNETSGNPTLPECGAKVCDEAGASKIVGDGRDYRHCTKRNETSNPGENPSGTRGKNSGLLRVKDEEREYSCRPKRNEVSIKEKSRTLLKEQLIIRMIN